MSKLKRVFVGTTKRGYREYESERRVIRLTDDFDRQAAKNMGLPIQSDTIVFETSQKAREVQDELVKQANRLRNPPFIEVQSRL